MDMERFLLRLKSSVARLSILGVDKSLVESEIDINIERAIRFERERKAAEAAKEAERAMPVTREWLLSIGGKNVPSDMGDNYEDHVEFEAEWANLNVWDMNGKCWVLSGNDSFAITTRGQLLDLLSGLGVRK